ncbi:MAG: hypothetical protein JST36_09560 [Bacteroidetes bacterium]|nr:hypothetical protein [Bacteroidota bacterium]
MYRISKWSSAGGIRTVALVLITVLALAATLFLKSAWLNLAGILLLSWVHYHIRTRARPSIEPKKSLVKDMQPPKKAIQSKQQSPELIPSYWHTPSPKTNTGVLEFPIPTLQIKGFPPIILN